MKELEELNEKILKRLKNVKSFFIVAIGVLLIECIFGENINSSSIVLFIIYALVLIFGIFCVSTYDISDETKDFQVKVAFWITNPVIMVILSSFFIEAGIGSVLGAYIIAHLFFIGAIVAMKEKQKLLEDKE